MSEKPDFAAEWRDEGHKAVPVPGSPGLTCMSVGDDAIAAYGQRMYDLGAASRDGEAGHSHKLVEEAQRELLKGGVERAKQLAAARAEGREELHKSLICEAVRRSQEAKINNKNLYCYDQPVPLWDCLQPPTPEPSELAERWAREIWEAADIESGRKMPPVIRSMIAKIDALLREKGLLDGEH